MKTVEDIDLKQLIEDETLEIFGRTKKIHSPLNPADDTPSFTVYFNTNYNKWKYKDFSTGEEGDALDFIQKYKNLSYTEARAYLGLEVEKSINETEKDKIESYINWQINNLDIYKGCKLIGLFQFKDENGKPIYYKAKLLDLKGKKFTPYYHLENDKVINKRGYDKEVIYGLYEALQGDKDNRIIIIVEGEKDANTVNMVLKNTMFKAISVKNVKDLSPLEYERIYVIGDTGEAGQKYIEFIKSKLFSTAPVFKIVKLPGLINLGDNKDVTDWLEAGHDKNDLFKAFKRSLDLKSRYELQQDNQGVYETKVKKIDGEETYIKAYLTDFKILDASKLTIVDEDKEGIRLKLLSCTGKEYEKVGNSNIFNDIKSFRNFLGTMDLNFLAEKTKDVVTLCKWINDYWAIENQEVHKGVKFKKVDDKLCLITQKGSITPTGVNKNIQADKSNDIDILDIEPIQKEELEEVHKHLFKFLDGKKSATIIGTVINNLCVNQCINNNVKLHHLLVVGESGSGKSTILERVIAPILNYPVKDKKSIGLITPFALTKDLSTGNYTSLYDEFKPSMISDKYKLTKISDVLRNLYDRQTVARGDKSFSIKEFTFSRPIIIAGEESYPNNEKALTTRSAIVYISKSERKKSNSDAIYWLDEHENLLNKFGRSLIDIVLNITDDEYKEIRLTKTNKFNLSDRPLNTAINIACGIEIYNKLLTSLGLTDKCLVGYEKYIESSIKDEVLEGSEDGLSIYEQMLVLFDTMIENGEVNTNDLIRLNGDALYIKTSEMIDRIHLYCKKYGSADLIPLKARDFKKQAYKGGYVYDNNYRKQITFTDTYQNVKKAWFDRYSLKKVRELGCMSIAPLSEFEEKVEKINNRPVQDNFAI